jgi:Domain of unknown function (DUF4351)
MILSDEAKVAFWQELRTYEEERQMPYITSVEQIGYDRGIEEEIKRSLERERSLIHRLLNRKVGSIDDRTLTQITNLSVAQLEDLGEALFDFDSIADLDRWLSQQR